MKLYKLGKKVEIRPLKKSDFKAWKSAYESLLPKQNDWDDPLKRIKGEFDKANYNSILEKQKKVRDAQTFIEFGIFAKNGNLVGFVSLMDISRGLFQNCFLGYRIFNNHWGKGYGKEAVKLAIEIAFKELKLHRVEAGIEPKNRRSIALAKSIGLRREGFSKKRLFLSGEWKDLVLYVALSEDFGIECQP